MFKESAGNGPATTVTAVPALMYCTVMHPVQSGCTDAGP